MTELSEHICTAEDCPTPANYYVTAIDDRKRVYYMAGPYQTHGDALAAVQTALYIATEINPWAWFMFWGTARSERTEPGRLNQLGKIV